MRNHSIDCLKAVCAFMVILIHVRTPYSHLVVPVTRCAVPIFLIISGYLVYDKNDNAKFIRNLEKNLRKVAWIGLWATMIFVPIKIISERGLGFITSDVILKWLFLNENPFGFHLWYLHAYLYALLVVLLFEKKGWLHGLTYAVPLLLLADLVFGKYSIAIWGREFPYIYLRNFLFVGIPYFLLGVMIKRHEAELACRRKASLYLTGGVICCITSVCESLALEYAGVNATRDHYISTTFLSLFLVLAALSYKTDRENVVAAFGRRYSLYVYVLHVLVFRVLNSLGDRLGLPNYFGVWPTFIYECLAPFFVLALTTLLTWLLMRCRVIR